VELHDHGGANAAFVVLDGELEELVLDPTPTAPGRLRRRHLATGDVSTVPAGVVHDVVNRSGGPATSLHVYADPLRSMTFYDRLGAPIMREVVQHVPALLSAYASGRALHPAASR
jgi:oxalate decarboxylase/phosphoglucose isomerase-like protein (cupin superfamily)